MDENDHKERITNTAGIPASCRENENSQPQEGQLFPKKEIMLCTGKRESGGQAALPARLECPHSIQILCPEYLPDQSTWPDISYLGPYTQWQKGLSYNPGPHPSSLLLPKTRPWQETGALGATHKRGKDDADPIID